MRVDAAEIGHNQGIRRDLGIAFWHTELFEGCDQESA